MSLSGPIGWDDKWEGARKAVDPDCNGVVGTLAPQRRGEFEGGLKNNGAFEEDPEPAGETAPNDSPVEMVVVDEPTESGSRVEITEFGVR